MTDAQLLERFVSTRDEGAFEALVLRHGPMVLGVCRQMLHDSHEAEDALQTTFLILVRNADTIRNQDSLASWLYGVAYRLALRRKSDVRRRVFTGAEVEMAADPHEDALEQGELLPVLHDEINRLPEKYRTPIVLCYLEGQSHEQAAERLKCPIGTIKGRLSRAREILKPRLSRRGLALSVGLMAMLFDRTAKAAVADRLLESTVEAAVKFSLGLSPGDAFQDWDVSAFEDFPAARSRRRFSSTKPVAGFALLVLLGAVVSHWLGFFPIAHANMSKLFAFGSHHQKTESCGGSAITPTSIDPKLIPALKSSTSSGTPTP